MSAELPLKPSQYQVNECTPSTGFPEETVLSAVRSPNSYLWLGTARGLLRFDGQRFEYIYPNTMRTAIWSLQLGAANEVISTVSGLGVVKAAGGQLSMLWARNITGRMNGIARGADGHLLLLDGAEVYREDKGRYWLWQRLPEAGMLLSEMRSGLWAVATGSKLLLIRGEARPIKAYPLPAPPGAMTLDAARDLWVGTTNGLIRFHLVGEELAREPTLASGMAITALASGRTGQLWVGTFRGLYRLDRERMVPFAENIRQKAETISSLTIDEDDSVWAAYQTGGLFRLAQPRFSNWGPAEGLRGPVIRSVAPDDEGGAWTAGADGLSHLNAQGRDTACAGVLEGGGALPPDSEWRERHLGARRGSLKNTAGLMPKPSR